MALMWFKKERLEDTNEVMKCPNRRGADNAMVKRKKTKGQAMIYKAQHRKLQIE
jgi:hypothetical protein